MFCIIRCRCNMLIKLEKQSYSFMVIEFFRLCDCSPSSRGFTADFANADAQAKPRPSLAAHITAQRPVILRSIFSPYMFYKCQFSVSDTQYWVQTIKMKQIRARATSPHIKPVAVVVWPLEKNHNIIAAPAILSAPCKALPVPDNSGWPCKLIPSNKGEDSPHPNPIAKL